MSQYVDMDTGEIIDAAQFRREQARIMARQKNLRAHKRRRAELYRALGHLAAILLVLGIALAVIRASHVDALRLILAC